MNFTIDASGGAQAVGQGLGNLLKAAAMAPVYRQQAQDDAAFNGAKLYREQIAAEKAGIDAEKARTSLDMQKDPLNNVLLSLGLPTNQAAQFRTKLETGSWGGAYKTPEDGVGPVLPAPANDETVQKLGQAMSLIQRMMATGSNVHQGAQAASEEQKQRGIDAVVANPALAGNYGKANAAAAGKQLFGPVGNTGYSMDNFTGDQIKVSDVLSKLFSSVETSKANNNNASAGLSSARRKRVDGGLDRPLTIVDDETGQASVTVLPTSGEPRTIGVAPANGTGVDATNAKTLNKVIADVERDMPGADDDAIMAEVTKRLARRGISRNKNPPPAKTGETMPQETKTIGAKTYVKVNGQWYEK